VPVGVIDLPPEGETIPFFAILLYAGQLDTLLEQTGWVARVVLAMLLLFSLFSWALIFQKLAHVFAHRPPDGPFLRIFRANRTLPDPRQMGGGGSPLESVYSAGTAKIESQVRSEIRTAKSRASMRLP
jgi:biopolymer transport protein ExbB/TolQ